MTAADLAPPPGQLAMFTAPGDRVTSWRVLSSDGWSEAIRHLPLAALRADATATRCGEAWLIAVDGTWCHVDLDGAVTPTTGWAIPAQHAITNRRTR